MPIGLSCGTGGECFVCSPCDICVDHYDRADNTDISAGSSGVECGWNEVSGAWDIHSNTLRCTTAGLILSVKEHPNWHSMSVEVKFKHDTNNSGIDVIVAAVSSTEYFYVRYKLTDGSLGTRGIDIRYKNGGSDTSLEDFDWGIYPNTLYTAKVCVSEDGFITGSLNGTAYVKHDASSFGISGKKFGLAAFGSGTATFDDFVAARTRNVTTEPTCDENPCSSPIQNCAACNDSKAPRWLKIVLAGIANKPAFCPENNSVDLNGTYYLPFVYGDITSCDYVVYDINDGELICQVPWNIRAYVYGPFGFGIFDPDTLVVDMEQDSGDGGPHDTLSIRQVRYQLNNAQEFHGGDCLSFEDVSVPWVNQGGTTNLLCEASLSTCTVTSVN
jgi:hypothetical protein